MNFRHYSAKSQLFVKFLFNRNVPADHFNGVGMREREIECYDTPSRHHGDGGSHQRVSSDRHQQSIYGDCGEHV